MTPTGTVRPVIEVSGIRKTYGKIVAVSDISFTVGEGEIFGLIGPNGAGKTTTMECVEGVRRPDRGVISILGLDPVRDVYKLQNLIGVQLQQAQLQKRIKVWEAVDLWASLYTKTVDGDRLLDQLGLSSKRNAWFMTLSGGQKQRLFIARAIYHEPKVLFLDEATSHLDSDSEQLVSQAIRALKMTRILVAHRKETIATADRVFALGLSLDVVARAEGVA
jgi:ABC-2 type transport system ATP-binding protein